jgi:hypothetical protein
MSRANKPNIGEPYQIYSEVLNVGKTVEGKLALFILVYSAENMS